MTEPRPLPSTWTCWHCGHLVTGNWLCIECVDECDECIATPDYPVYDLADLAVDGENICRDHCVDCRLHPFGTCAEHEVSLEDYRRRIDKKYAETGTTS